jgi:hypothetical protein
LVMCAEKVMRLLRLFFVFLCGWFWCYLRSHGPFRTVRRFSSTGW